MDSYGRYTEALFSVVRVDRLSGALSNYPALHCAYSGLNLHGHLRGARTRLVSTSIQRNNQALESHGGIERGPVIQTPLVNPFLEFETKGWGRIVRKRSLQHAHKTIN